VERDQPQPLIRFSFVTEKQKKTPKRLSFVFLFLMTDTPPATERPPVPQFQWWN
jgi:hypothetical protein